MPEIDGLEAFISDLDKIIIGEPIDPSEHEQYDAEHKELLYLAQLLAEADYTPETRGGGGQGQRRHRPGGGGP